jgi:hypothetical protein
MEVMGERLIMAMSFFKLFLERERLYLISINYLFPLSPGNKTSKKP